MLAEQGQRDRALQLFQSLVGSSLANSEERAVLGIKIGRLLAGSPPAAAGAASDLSAASLHTGLSIGLVLINQSSSSIALSDLCLVLESKWLIRCEVLAPVSIPEELILVAERGQYAADKVLSASSRRTGSRPACLTSTSRPSLAPGVSPSRCSPRPARCWASLDRPIRSAPWRTPTRFGSSSRSAPASANPTSSSGTRSCAGAAGRPQRPVRRRAGRRGRAGLSRLRAGVSCRTTRRLREPGQCLGPEDSRDQG